MKIAFLYDHLQKRSIDNKDQILEALVTHNWKITDINTFPSVNHEDTVIDLESDKGFWLSNIPLNLFSKEVLVEELIALNKNNKK